MLSDRIRCEICGRQFKALEAHVRMIHDVSGDEYKRRFHVLKLCSQEIRFAIARQVVRQGWGRVPWTEERVVREIRRVAGRGGMLADSRVKRSSLALYLAGKHHFGSWAAAVKAAGLDYDGARVRKKYRHWTRERLIRAILARKERGTRLNLRGVREEDPGLVQACQYHFGSWQAAIEASGLDYGGIRKRRAHPAVRMRSSGPIGGKEPQP